MCTHFCNLCSPSHVLSFDFKMRMSAFLHLNLCVSMSKSWSLQAEAAGKWWIPAKNWKPHLGIVKDLVPFQLSGICLKFTGSTPVRASHLSLINQIRIQFLTLLFLFPSILSGCTKLKSFFSSMVYLTLEDFLIHCHHFNHFPLGFWFCLVTFGCTDSQEMLAGPQCRLSCSELHSADGASYLVHGIGLLQSNGFVTAGPCREKSRTSFWII